MSVTTAQRIAQLNDEFRTGGPAPGWFLTSGIEAKGIAFVIAVVAGVRAFDTFVAGNDPYGEHDFGSIDVMGEQVFWKIDYYDLSLSAGSPDPGEPEVTRRILTIMLASEY